MTAGPKPRLPSVTRRAVRFAEVFLGADLSWQHVFEQYLKRHGVATARMRDEELAVAAKLPIRKADLMIVVVAMEGQVERVEPEPFAFLAYRLAFSILPIIHSPSVALLRIRE